MVRRRAPLDLPTPVATRRHGGTKKAAGRGLTPGPSDAGARRHDSGALRMSVKQTSRRPAIQSSEPRCPSTAERVGQDRAGRLRRGAGRPRLRTGLDRRHRHGARRAPACRSLDVSDVTGFPEMMDGRVKTLHPAVHGGILARRSRPDDLAAIGRHGIRPIDLVVVNLYPFVRAAANPGDAVRRAGRGDRHRRAEPGARGREELPRRAGRRVAGRLRAVLEQLDRPGGPSLAFRFELARKAFAHTAAYDAAIAAELERRRRGRRGVRADAGRGRRCPAA